VPTFAARSVTSPEMFDSASVIGWMFVVVPVAVEE
jgi:hypothetical protein